MATGKNNTAPGRTEAANGTFGTSAAWRSQSTTSSMDREEIYQILTDEVSTVRVSGWIYRSTRR